MLETSGSRGLQGVDKSSRSSRPARVPGSQPLLADGVGQMVSKPIKSVHLFLYISLKKRKHSTGLDWFALLVGRVICSG